MIGQHPTPPALVRQMLQAAGVAEIVSRGGKTLDAGCGEGAFLIPLLEAYCEEAKRRRTGVEWVAARLKGIELDPKAVSVSRASVSETLRRFGFRSSDKIMQAVVEEADYLAFQDRDWDLIVGNPPYVRIEGLSEDKRRAYRRDFASATNRFDLYFLFFEQSIKLLKSLGTLCFVTPQKFAQVWSGGALREILAKHKIESIRILSEDAFPALVTYPAVTLIRNEPPSTGWKVRIDNERAKFTKRVPQAELGFEPWFQIFAEENNQENTSGVLLQDICSRIGVGVATGADEIFVFKKDKAGFLPKELLAPSISGRQLPNQVGKSPESDEVMLFPYDQRGESLPESSLGSALTYLSLAHVKAHLMARTCARSGKKKWYQYHETPRPAELKQPKILTQDIQKTPQFHVDRQGLVPRHSVYYLVPRKGVDVDRLALYLNSDMARHWLIRNSQHAAHGHFRIQTKTLSQLPVPPQLLAPGRRVSIQSQIQVAA